MEHQNILTEEQQNILRMAGTSDKRIESGVLASSEKKLLDVFEQARLYLTVRYPDETFAFVALDTSAPRINQAQFIVTGTTTGEATFAVKVKYGSDTPGYQISDSHFADLKKADLNQLVEHLLAEMGVTAKADLQIVGLYDDSYSPVSSLSETLQSGKTLSVSGWILVTGDVSLAQFRPAIESALYRAGLRGGLRMRLVDGVSLDEAFQAKRTEKAFVTDEIYLSLPE
ncbi:MAG: hypothetical protein E7319_05730 [Clostridiales bacterium]|nr:hypothetical protein [Clostridiales bacterium]